MSTLIRPANLPEHKLIMCYDRQVDFAGANQTDFVDQLYATWFVRRGPVWLSWAGARVTVRGGHWVFCDPGFVRTQRFNPTARQLSIRTQISWAGSNRMAPSMPPLIVSARRIPELLPVAEALANAVNGEEGGTLSTHLERACRVEARFQDWLEVWYAVRSRLGRGPVWPVAGDPRLERILAVLQQSSNRDSVPYKKLKEVSGLSRAQIDRLFMKTFNRTPRSWCDHALLTRAEELLGQGVMSIKEVAYRLGFLDPSHFTKWYRLQRGVTPRAFREGRWA